MVTHQAGRPASRPLAAAAHAPSMEGVASPRGVQRPKTLEYQCVKFMTEVTSMGCTVVSGYIVHSTQSGQCTCAQWAQWAAQWAGCRSVK